LKIVPSPLKTLSDFKIVVDFAIENKMITATDTVEGLSALIGKINDAQTYMPENARALSPLPAGIRTPVT
jgi:hypothetical protein